MIGILVTPLSFLLLESSSSTRFSTASVTALCKSVLLMDLSTMPPRFWSCNLFSIASKASWFWGAGVGDIFSPLIGYFSASLEVV